jgi:membrane associated rhomboid family serine protease
MPHPDLFVVCKNCQAEVSPYITECPYCGTRLRKRAPKIERPDAPPSKAPRRAPRPGSGARAKPKPKAKAAKAAKAQRDDAPRLGRLRSGEIPGIRVDEHGKPWATIVLVALSFGLWFTLAFYALGDFALRTLDGAPWRYLTASLVNGNTSAQFAIVIGLGLFGWLLERRHGPLVVVGLFLLCGPGALAIAVALDPNTFVFGSHGAALGLLCAWLVPVLVARRRDDDDDDADLLGVLVIAVVLALVPVLSQGSAMAGLIGAGLGALVGLVFAGLRRARR